MKAGNFLFTYVFFSTIFFSRNDVSGQRFREAEGEASPQSPPAGALLLLQKKKWFERFEWFDPSPIEPLNPASCSPWHRDRIPHRPSLHARGYASSLQLRPPRYCRRPEEIQEDSCCGRQHSGKLPRMPCPSTKMGTLWSPWLSACPGEQFPTLESF